MAKHNFLPYSRQTITEVDIQAVAERAWVDRPDLSRVDEIGWTDLMAGGGTPASSRVDWIEVYGKPVKRQ